MNDVAEGVGGCMLPSASSVGTRARLALARKVDVRLPGKENSNSHGARPVHQMDSDQ